MISKKNKELYDLGKGDNLIEFDLSNPTTSDVTYDLFNTTTLSIVPTVANPVVAPTVVSATITVPAQPFKSVFNSINNTIYVLNVPLNNVNVIDCVSNLVIGSAIPVGTNPQDGAFCSANNTVYIANINSSDISVINCLTNTVIATIPLPVFPNGIAYNSLNNSMYITNQFTNNIYVIDCNTNAISVVIPIPTGSNNIEYNTLNNSMYVIGQPNSSLQVIDCNTNTFTTSILLGSSGNNLAYNSLSNTMYVPRLPANVVVIVDCNTNSVVGNISINSPFAIAYDSLTNTMYVTRLVAGTVRLIDCNINAIIAVISTGAFPTDVIFNYLNNSIYVTDSATNNISVISPLIPQVSYIGGSFDYNAFIQDVINNPVGVDRFVIVSQNNGNFNQVLNVVYKDANGIETQNPFIPSLSVGTSQFQSGIGKVDFPNSELVLGVNQYLSNFLVKANSEVKVLLIYKQLEKSKLLSDKKAMCGRLEIKGNPLQTFNPTNHDAPFDYFPIIPIKPTKPSIRPFSIRDIVPTKPIKDLPIRPTNVKPDVKVDVKPDIRTNVKPDVKVDIKPDVKTDTTPSIKPLTVSYFSIYGGGGKRDITCGACEWSWNRNESDADDVYVCHKCGYDNQKIYENEKFRV